MSLSLSLSLLMGGYMLYSILQVARKQRATTGKVLEALRWHHLPLALGLLSLVLCCGYLLVTHAPLLNVSWLNLLHLKGTNILFSPATEANSAAAATSSDLLPKLLGGGFLLLLITALPVFAHGEEELFRRPWPFLTFGGRLLNSLLFGLMHMVVGVPLSAALALAVGGYGFGLYNGHCYRLQRAKQPAPASDDEDLKQELAAQEAATYSSAALHAVYNLLIVLFLGAVLLLA